MGGPGSPTAGERGPGGGGSSEHRPEPLPDPAGTGTGPRLWVWLGTTAQICDCGSGFRCRTTAQTQDPALIQDHSSDTEPQIRVWIQDRGSDMGPRLHQETTAPPSDTALRPSHRTLTLDLDAELRMLSHRTPAPESDVGPRLRQKTPAPSLDVGLQPRHGTPDPGLEAGPQLRHKIPSLGLDTGPRLGHRTPSPSSAPNQTTEPSASQELHRGRDRVVRAELKSPVTRARTHCGEGCSPHEGFLGAGRARGAVTAWRSGSVAGARCRCRILWVIKSPPAPRGEIAALGDSDKAAGEIPSEMQKRCAGKRCR